jgi:CheY-like chemotaxis protein
VFLPFSRREQIPQSSRVVNLLELFLETRRGALPAYCTRMQAQIPVSRRLRILLVDDSFHLRAAIADALMMAGNDVTVAHSGTDALEQFAPGKFDLVMTDFAMPAPNGVELADCMKEREPELRVVLLSGYADALPSGDKPASVDLLLRKPISLQALTSALATLGARSALN